MKTIPGTILYGFITATVAATISLSTATDCRQNTFDPYPENKKTLVNHVIEEHTLASDQMCRVMCYLHHDCVSYNLGPSQTPGMLLCQLNNADRYQYPQDYKDKTGYSYRGTENICGKNPCLANQTCQSGFNIDGYRCLCPEGSTGKHCELDIDECSTNAHNCSVEAVCINKQASFLCKCLPGFHGDGVTCTDIDECLPSARKCSPHASCNNTHGSFQCVCLTGFQGDGLTCNDIDECSSTSLTNCSSFATCNNTPGSFQCTCNNGFLGDGFNCRGNGKTCDSPAQTCSLLKATFPGTVSGVYWLNPGTNTSNSSFQAFCDMDTEAGGWTLVWSYTFTMYNNFNNFLNAVTPGPKNLGLGLLSDTAPLNETDYNAIDYLLWKTIGSEFMIKSNINNWVACVPGSGSLVTKTVGSVSCRMVKVVNSRCEDVVPGKFGFNDYGIVLKAAKIYYYFVTDTRTHWPTHDPCGQTAPNHLTNVQNPHGNIYIR